MSKFRAVAERAEGTAEVVKKFTIGEIASFYGISEPTLRYYDQIGLFKPKMTDSANGYRYYSVEQFEHLNIIQYLRYLGISLKEMKKHFDFRDEESFVQMLIYYKDLNEKKLRDLTIIQNRFSQRIDELEKTLNLVEVEIPWIERLVPRKILCMKEQIKNRSELEITLKRLEKRTCLKPSLFIGRVGVCVAKADLERKAFTQYSAISIFPEEEVEDLPGLVTLPGEEYACIYCRTPMFETASCYKLLLDYIQSEGYSVVGDSVERLIIDDFITKDRQKHLSEIQIPVARLR